MMMDGAKKGAFGGLFQIEIGIHFEAWYPAPCPRGRLFITFEVVVG